MGRMSSLRDDKGHYVQILGLMVKLTGKGIRGSWENHFLIRLNGLWQLDEFEKCFIIDVGVQRQINEQKAEQIIRDEVKLLGLSPESINGYMIFDEI